MMGKDDRDYAEDTEYPAETIRWALVLGVVGVIITFGAYFAGKLAMMMLIAESVNVSEFAVMMRPVYGVSFAGSVLIMAGFIGLARTHGSALGWIFLATWLVSTIWGYYVSPFVFFSSYFYYASSVQVHAIALANGYVLWTIRQSTVYPSLTIGVILSRLAGPYTAAILPFLLLEWIWPNEPGMDYLVYPSVGIMVFALTSLLTLLLFAVEIRRLNQAKHLSPELQSLS